MANFKGITLPDGTTYLPEGGGGSSGNGDVWEEIENIPLSPEVSLYNLGKVKDWKKLRLVIFRANKNTSLTAITAVRISGGGSIKAAVNLLSIKEEASQVDIEVNNLFQFGVNFATGNKTGLSREYKSCIKGNGFLSNLNYVYDEADEYRFTLLGSADAAFDGTETAILYGVRR